MDSYQLIKQKYENEVVEHLPFETIFATYAPEDKRDHIVINCPDCGQYRAVVYKDTGAIFCNRKGSCKYTSDIPKFMNKGVSPRGRRFFEVMKQLYDMANVTFPIEFTPEQMAAYEQYEHERDRKQKIFNDLEAITIEFLYSPDIAAAKEAIKYLEDRGYPLEKARKTNIGFYPSPKTIALALEQKGHSDAEIKASGLYRDDWKGRIIFPIKEHGIIGDFVAGDITRKVPDKEKYLRMSGKKAPDNSMLLGLDDAGNSIILVEGFFDYRTLAEAGIENGVMLGGCHLWDAHPAQIEKHKIKNIILFLDNDEAGINGTLKTIEELKNADVEVYVADHKSLGASKDPDKFVRDHGIDKLNELLKKTVHGFEYKAQHLLDKHKGEGEWTTAKKYKLFDEAAAFYASIINSKRALANEAFWEIIMYGADVSETTIAQYRKEAQEKRVLEEQRKLLEARKKRMQSLIDSGDFDAIAAEAQSYKEQSNNQDQQFAFLLENNTEAKLITKFKNLIPGIETGYPIGERDLIFPGGAITILAGATGHGKTTAMINLSLGAIRKNPNLSVYFFTVEESEEFVEAQFLNICMNKQLNDGRNREAIIHYFHAASTEQADLLKYIKTEMRADFEQNKATYYKEIIDQGRLRIFSPEGDAKDLIEQIKWLKKNTNVGLICIDYIQLLRLQEKSQSSRQEELKEICLQLNACAKQTGLPIVVAAQFNREVQREEDMSPQRIGEAGDIERAGNIIIGMWNRNFDENKHNVISFTVLKGRRIGIGHKSVFSFDGNTGVIKNEEEVKQNEPRLYPLKRRLNKAERLILKEIHI